MVGKKIGVGIVGLSASGGWAGLAHVPALRALSDDFELLGLSASSMDSARAAADAHGVRFFTDSPLELAARDDIDLVAVTVKVPHHRELVEQVVAKGKMVFCEWPLGNGLDEAEYLADLVTRHDLRSFVGLQARSAPPVRFIREMVRDGYVGRVLSTTLVASGDFPWGGIATKGTAYVNDRTTGATMLSIPFGHTIDALTWILGEVVDVKASLAVRRPEARLLDSPEIIKVTAPDQVAVSGILSDGSVLSAHYRGGTSRGTNFLWEINGTEGDLVVSGPNGHLQYGHVTIKGGRGEGALLTDLAVPEKYSLIDVHPASYHYAVAHAYRSIADDIRMGTREVPGFAEALETHRLLDRIEQQF